MRARLILPVLALLVVGIVAFALTRTNSAGTASADPPTLPTRVVQAGSTEVKIDPVELDGTGASFNVSLDTHAGDLGTDLAKASTLTVGGTSWGGATWTGDPAGGHHREGKLAFQADGTPSGIAELTITGLDAPVEVTWNVPGG